jgi:hypothetical protein
MKHSNTGAYALVFFKHFGGLLLAPHASSELWDFFKEVTRRTLER